LPGTIRSALFAALRQARILWSDFGEAQSFRTGACVDANGKPIPWYTYSAIEYIKQLDFHDKDVFEYGAGQSTLFWGERARSVVSVEDEEQWVRTLRPRLPANCELLLETDLAEYVNVIDRYNPEFDVIVVDGPTRGMTRLKCCRAAVRHLRSGGMIILDNSDWLPMSAMILRDSGLIEVDMFGFFPLSDGNTQTTSLFLHPAFAFKPSGQQPRPGPGAVIKNWEPPLRSEAPFVECNGEVFAAVNRDEVFEFATPDGPRRFRLITTRRLADRGPWAAILDLDRDRVLLSIKEPTDGLARSVEEEINRIRALDWEAFRKFMGAHPKRRYVL
jgi:hypothetical protein